MRPSAPAEADGAKEAMSIGRTMMGSRTIEIQRRPRANRCEIAEVAQKKQAGAGKVTFSRLLDL
jgi:hypothetical protein